MSAGRLGAGGHAGRVLAVTSAAPYTASDEAFVQDELTEMVRQGVDLTVVPMRLRLADANTQSRASGLAAEILAEALLSPTILWGAMRTLARRPGAWSASSSASRAARGSSEPRQARCREVTHGVGPALVQLV